MSYAGYVFPVIMLLAFGGYAIWMMQKRGKMMTDSGPGHGELLPAHRLPLCGHAARAARSPRAPRDAGGVELVFIGAIDEVVLYDRVVTDAEALALD